MQRVECCFFVFSSVGWVGGRGWGAAGGGPWGVSVCLRACARARACVCVCARAGVCVCVSVSVSAWFKVYGWLFFSRGAGGFVAWDLRVSGCMAFGLLLP